MMPPGGAPRAPGVHPERTTEGVGSRSAGTSATGTGVAAARSLTNAWIGNQGWGAIGAGVAALWPGGYQATSVQRPVVAPPPHSASVSPSMLSTQTAGAGSNEKVCDRPIPLDWYPPLRQKTHVGWPIAPNDKDLPMAEIKHRRKSHPGGCYTGAGSQLRAPLVGKTGKPYLRSVGNGNATR